MLDITRSDVKVTSPSPGLDALLDLCASFASRANYVSDLLSGIARRPCFKNYVARIYRFVLYVRRNRGIEHDFKQKVNGLVPLSTNASRWERVYIQKNGSVVRSTLDPR